MSSLVIILALLSGAGALSYFGFRHSERLGNIFVIIGAFVPAIYFFFTIDTSIQFSFTLGGLSLMWQYSAYSIIFAKLVLVLAPLALLFSSAYMNKKVRLGTFYFNYFLSVMGMTGILMSQDFISLFIFWEIMTWSSYLIVIYAGKEVETVGIRYMVFSAIGAYSMLMALVFINKETGSFLLDDVFANFAQMDFNMQLLIGVLLLIGFSIKAAVMPLHVWAPGAYSNSPMSYTAIFSGALSKMGIYGLGLVFIKLFAGNQYTFINEIFAWAGGITAVMATFLAVTQDDAKRMLAYSSIAQLGYIVLGLAIGTEMSVMAAIYLAILHAAFKGNLFMVVGAVERQTGSTDMTVVTGLIRKMPWTFVSALISIIALAGIPPLGGFIGKWLLYESMITSNHFVLIIFAFLASTAAFLYCYKFLYSFFLGQEEPEFKNVKEAPFVMVLPMMLISVFLVVTGTFPGLLFEPIAHGMEYLGFQSVDWNMSMLINAWGDEVNLIDISSYIGVLFVIVLIFITMLHRKKTRYVGTKDISTSGEVPLDTDNLSYKTNFYKPFERAIAPVLKRSMNALYDEIGNGLSALFQFIRYIYTGNGQAYALYVVLFLVLLLIFKQQIFGF